MTPRSPARQTIQAPATNQLPASCTSAIQSARSCPVSGMSSCTPCDAIRTMPITKAATVSRAHTAPIVERRKSRRTTHDPPPARLRQPERLEDARPEGARCEPDRESGGFVLVVEDGIDLHELQRAEQSALGDELHHQVRLAVREAAADRRTDARRDVGIDEVEVDRDMDERRARHPLERLAQHGLDP